MKKFTIFEVACVSLTMFLATIGAGVAQDLQLPPITTGPPEAGIRVAVTPSKYQGTAVHHMLYLPTHWKPPTSTSAKIPVIVEYTGNQFLAAGSTGRVEDAGLGYGICNGNFIWITMPFVSKDHQSNAVTWWGDTEATVEYAKATVSEVCTTYGGDASRVFLCGFSRGAIAASYIGLHDDSIASLWAGFITHDHFDGVRAWNGTDWGTPLPTYRQQAAQRLRRAGMRPWLICQSGSTDATRDFLESVMPLNHITFLPVDTRAIQGDFPNPFAKHAHNDRWLLRQSDQKQKVTAWLKMHAENPSELDQE